MATLGYSQSAPSSFSAILKQRRRLSQHQARGCQEIAIYERFSPNDDGYSDHDMQGSDDSASSSDDALEPEEPEMEMEDLDQGSEQLPIPHDKGKGKAVDCQHDHQQQKQQAVGPNKKRSYSCNERAPKPKNVIILLKQTSGWTFSQDAFIPTYMRGQYYLAGSCSTSPGSVSSYTSSSSYATSLAERDSIDDQTDLQPPVTDIILPPSPLL